MGPISSFSLWCAGVIPRIIKDNDLNSGKYIALGILMFQLGHWLPLLEGMLEGMQFSSSSEAQRSR